MTEQTLVGVLSAQSEAIGLTGWRQGDFRPLEAGVDWLTLTADEREHLEDYWGAYRAAVREVLGVAETEPAVRGGYVGVACATGFLGMRNDGRWALMISGSVPDTVFMQGLREGVRVTRIDLQVTGLAVFSGDQLGTVAHFAIERNVEAGRVDTRLSRLGYGVGGRIQTQYIGAASSGRRIRIYDKTLQSGKTADGRALWRIEVQYRAKYALNAFNLVIARVNWSTAVYAILMGEMARVSLPIGSESDGLIVRSGRFEPKTGLGAKLEWVRVQVGPTLAKLAESEQYRVELLDLLDELGVVSWLGVDNRP